MRRDSPRTKGIAAILLLAFFSVIMGVVTRELSTTFTLFQQIYLRLFCATLFGFIVFPKLRSQIFLRSISRHDLSLALVRAIIGFVIAAPLWVSGFAQAKLANAVMIDAIPMSSLMGFIILKETVTLTKIALLLLSFAGAAIISLKGAGSLGALGKGELLVFVATILFALRNVMRRFHTKVVNDAQITIVMHAAGALSLFVLSLLVGESLPFYAWTPRSVFLVLAGGLLNVGILFTTNYGFAKVDAVTAGNLSLTAVVFGVLLGSILYAEAPTLREIFGGILIIISVVSMNRYAQTPIANNDK